MNQNNRPANDRLEEVIEAFQQMSVPDRPCDAEVLGRLGTYRGHKAASKRPYRIRLLFSSAAAALLLAGSLGLLVLNNAAPLAVADVVKAAQKHKLVRYKQQQTMFKEQSGSEPIDSMFYADLTAARLRGESHVQQPDGEVVLISVCDGVHRLEINSLQKTAVLGPTEKDFKAFCCSLEDFEKKKGVRQVKDRLAGLVTVKYCFEDDDQASSLWVDAKTRLPVRMEQELADSAGNIVRKRLVWTDFEWDPELPKGFRNVDELFSTRPPEGYTLDDRSKRKKQRDR